MPVGVWAVVCVKGCVFGGVVCVRIGCNPSPITDYSLHPPPPPTHAEQSFEVLKEYKSAAPINSAALSPIFDHVLIGGGQDAAAVTTTNAKSGYFEARFFHKVFAEEFANARGHFSPINSGALRWWAGWRAGWCGQGVWG